MKDQLKDYIDLLFAGAPQAADIKQEILQNTLDRYDDLIEQGKAPAAAYQLAISGIGDISELLGVEAQSAPTHQAAQPAKQGIAAWKKTVRAIAVCLYIMCPIPLFVLQNEAGLCGLLAFVAVATALNVIAAGKEVKREPAEVHAATPQGELRRAVRGMIWAVGICIYFAVSISLDAWYITWVIFPLIAAVQGLVIACMDLREAIRNER